MYYQCTTNDLNYFYFVRKRKIQMRCKEFLVAMCGTAPKIFFKKRNSFLYAYYYFWAINTNPDLMARDFLTVEFPFGETIVWLFNSLEEIFRLDGFQINTSIITTVERHTWGASKDDDDSVTFCGGGRMVTRNPCLGVLICSACHREMKPKYLHL